MARPALGYRSLEARRKSRPRQMVTVPQGIQDPAYAPLSAHNPGFEFSFESDLPVVGNNHGTAR